MYITSYIQQHRRSEYIQQVEPLIGFIVYFQVRRRHTQQVIQNYHRTLSVYLTTSSSIAEPCDVDVLDMAMQCDGLNVLVSVPSDLALEYNNQYINETRGCQRKDAFHLFANSNQNVCLIFVVE